jgi:hypothetical protein
VGLLQCPNGKLDHTFVVVRPRCLLVLLRRQSEEQDGGDAELVRAAGLGHGLGDRQPFDARHRLDRRAPPLAELHEQGQHEMRRSEFRLADHAAQNTGLAQAAEARRGESHRLGV